MNPYKSTEYEPITRDEIIRLMPGRMAYGIGFWRGFYVGFLAALLFVIATFCFAFFLRWLTG